MKPRKMQTLSLPVGGRFCFTNLINFLIYLHLEMLVGNVDFLILIVFQLNRMKVSFLQNKNLKHWQLHMTQPSITFYQ